MEVTKFYQGWDAQIYKMKVAPSDTVMTVSNDQRCWETPMFDTEAEAHTYARTP